MLILSLMALLSILSWHSHRSWAKVSFIELDRPDNCMGKEKEIVYPTKYFCQFFFVRVTFQIVKLTLLRAL